MKLLQLLVLLLLMLLVQLMLSLCVGLLALISLATLKDRDGDDVANEGEEGRKEFSVTALLSGSFTYDSSSAILNFNICISWVTWLNWKLSRQNCMTHHGSAQFDLPSPQKKIAGAHKSVSGNFSLPN